MSDSTPPKPGSVPSPLRREIVERDDHECQYCGVAEPIAELEVHHIKPSSDGGEHSRGNLVTLCQRCHRALHALADGPTYPPEQLSEYEGKVSINVTELDYAILDYLQEGKNDGEPWGRATPAGIEAALQERGYEDIPVRQAINDHMKKLEHAGHLRNQFGKGLYEFISDPRKDGQ